MKPFQVVVGNIGTVYEGNNYKKAWREYREAVTFFHNGEPCAEFAGTVSNEDC